LQELPDTTIGSIISQEMTRQQPVGQELADGHQRQARNSSSNQARQP
jgi:hypothetical protein